MSDRVISPRQLCDRVAELEAENTRLAQELARVRQVLNEPQPDDYWYLIERLEVALRDLVVNYYDYVGQTQGGVEAIQRARAALSEVGEP